MQSKYSEMINTVYLKQKTEDAGKAGRVKDVKTNGLKRSPVEKESQWSRTWPS